MAKLVFYCRDTLSNIENIEYYAVDIKALKELGYDVVICTRYRDIPWDFDVIYVYWWTYALYPILLAKFLGKASYVSGVFNFKFPEWQDGNDYFKRPLWQRTLMRLALKYADGNLLTSFSDYKNCSEYFNLKNCHYTPCCIDDDYFDVERSPQKNTLMNIAWSGYSNLQRKGVFDIVSALQLVKEKGVEFTLRLVGAEGDGKDALLNLVDEKGLSKNVVYYGEVSKEKKIELLASSDLYVQPSNYEGFGLASAEAMAAGLRVIACDVGDVKNTLGEYAVYVKNGDVQDIADNILRLMGSDQDACGGGMSGRDYLKSRFSYNQKVKDLKDVLLSA